MTASLRRVRATEPRAGVGHPAGLAPPTARGGYENWKRLQRTGYLALVFTLVHVALLGQGVFLERIVGRIAIGFILLVLLAQMREQLRRAAPAERPERAT